MRSAPDIEPVDKPPNPVGVPMPAAEVATGRSSRSARALNSPHSASASAGTPITRKVIPTIVPPSSPSAGIASEVFDAISVVAPVPAKKSPHPKVAHPNVPVSRGPRSRLHGGVPRRRKSAPPISPAKTPPTISRIAVSIPSGHSRAISNGWLPEAQVPTSSSSTSLTLNSTVPPMNSAAPKVTLSRNPTCVPRGSVAQAPASVASSVSSCPGVARSS